MGVRVNVRMFKIMCTPIKVRVRTYATYANCRTLGGNGNTPLPAEIPL